MNVLKFEIEGFRSIKSQTWEPGDLNVLIGPNGSGKSNLLRALEMLSSSAKGGLEEFVQREGGMEALAWDGTAAAINFRMEVSIPPLFSEIPENCLKYELTLARLGGSNWYRVQFESLVRFARDQEGNAPSPARLVLKRMGGQASIYSENESLMEAVEGSVPEHETLLSIATGPFNRNRLVQYFQEKLASWSVHQDFCTHRDSAIRSATVARMETQLSPDAQNLVPVLHTLYTTNRDFEDDINKAMVGVFGDEFVKLVFPPASDQRVQLRVRWRSLRREQSAADLSDGTLRFLYLLAILANPDPPALIAIDEPETGLHPSMFYIVAEYAADAAMRSQVILATHSPGFLDAFKDAIPTTTVVDFRDGETQLDVMSDELLNHWLEGYSLGEVLQRIGREER